ncbi:MAG: hypothetical protein CML17_07460 [Pusillimonas sp.]|nr:hypothetical protein [Pusillimonas sp.]
MTNADNRHLLPVKYIGKKPQKVDNVANTGLIWTPGQIHFLPPMVAQKLSAVKDVWQIVDDATVDQDPANIGLVVTQVDPDVSEHDDPNPRTFDLPNLEGMTRADISQYAESNFNTKLPANAKKEEMIAQIVTLANSRAAGEIE